MSIRAVLSDFCGTLSVFMFSLAAAAWLVKANAIASEASQDRQRGELATLHVKATAIVSHAIQKRRRLELTSERDLVVFIRGIVGVGSATSSQPARLKRRSLSRV